MRVLALVTDAFGAGGGIAQYNRDLLSAWAGAAEIRVIARNGRPAEADLPPGLRQLGSCSGRLRYAGKALIEAVAWRPAVIFCGHLYMAPLAAALAAVTGARLVLQVHGIEAWQRPSPLRRRAAERADLVLSVSRYTRSRLLRWAALQPERCMVLPNTVGEAYVPGDRESARARFSLGDETVLLSVGRLAESERYKGHDRVIELLRDTAERHSGLLYLIAGIGRDSERLAALAARGGVQGRVRFLGNVPADALPELYRAADLFVMPSTGEGFGIVFLEAMACGTPALGLAVAGACDALGDGALGAAVSETDLGVALDQLLTLPRSRTPQLPDGVAARFGKGLFRARARALIDEMAA